MAASADERAVPTTSLKEDITNGIALLLTGFGSYDKLKVATVGCPDADSLPSTNVIVHMKANGINFSELMRLQGLNDRLPKLPGIIGYEGSGDVVMVGADVKNFKVIHC